MSKTRPRHYVAYYRVSTGVRSYPGSVWTHSARRSERLLTPTLDGWSPNIPRRSAGAKTTVLSWMRRSRSVAYSARSS
jgi:hypothetical protein